MPSSTILIYWVVYVLRSLKDGKYYVGFTKDLNRRYTEHQNGEVFSTKSRRPLIVVYYEGCLSKEDAERRENYLKTTGGRRFLAKRLRVYKSEVK
ncbi:GIY-YIG nuclease family protein [Candidatus Uhrbacteria bacterium]|nr:GIY-YIG nuclease family protein [Candidatus Uhrbacteria bacterium]